MKAKVNLKQKSGKPEQNSEIYYILENMEKTCFLNILVQNSKQNLTLKLGNFRYPIGLNRLFDSFQAKKLNGK
jgi:hypothetical protein